MADFCKQCSIENFGEDGKDFASLNRHEHINVLCEGCGIHCVVDFTGTCISTCCLKKHGLLPSIQDDMSQQENEIARYYDELSNYPG